MGGASVYALPEMRVERYSPVFIPDCQGGALTPLTPLTGKQHTLLQNALRDLCDIFWGLDAGRCEEIFHGRFPGAFIEPAFLLEGEGADALAEMKTFVATFDDPAALCGCLEEEYVRLFISDRSGIKAPLFHSCHIAGGGQLMGEPARMMKALLAEQGLDLEHSVHEPPDHLSIELEYLYYLLQRGWKENDRTLLGAAARFASDTMLPWVRVFQRRLSESATVSFFPCAATLVIMLLQRIAEKLDVFVKKTPAP
jgi:TorA-specific chaperone